MVSIITETKKRIKKQELSKGSLKIDKYRFQIDNYSIECSIGHFERDPFQLFNGRVIYTQGKYKPREFTITSTMEISKPYNYTEHDNIFKEIMEKGTVDIISTVTGTFKGWCEIKRQTSYDPKHITVEIKIIEDTSNLKKQNNKKSEPRMVMYYANTKKNK